MATKIKPLAALLEGPSGHGKSWAGSTVPPPRLLVDIEGRAGYTPLGSKAVEWDGDKDPMTLERTESRTYILNASDPNTCIETCDAALQWLRSGKHPFVGVSVDSVMEYQTRLITNRFSGRLPEPQEWGEINQLMDQWVRGFRDLTWDPTNSSNAWYSSTESKWTGGQSE